VEESTAIEEGPSEEGALELRDNRPIRDRQPRMPQEQNPELLHWRANVLLDEMMLGAIDIAVGDSVPARALSSVPPTASRQQTPGEERTDKPAANSSFATPPYPDSSAVSAVASSHSTPRTPAPSATSPRTENATPVRGEARSTHSPSNPEANAQAHPQHGTEQWLFAAEQRYQQIAARQQANRRVTPAHEYDGWSMAATEETVNGYDAPSYGQHSASDYATADYATAGAGGHAAGGSSGESVATPLNGSTGSRTSTKPASNGRGVRKSLRSNLLPRMNSLDSQSVQQEIHLLQNAVESTLPTSHETRVRAQHLLQKAYTILQEDATRSAEVDYYLQQVRTIVQRGQETAHWSSLYQSRLQIYLYGWLALSLIVILCRYAYAEPLSNWLAWFTASTVDSLLVYNLLTIAVAFFFGALGGGGGALLNMVQHARMSAGFFDRKYGLRGLILPVIGAVVGLVLCVLFGLLYALLGIDPTISIWFGLLPAFIALALGASQEYFYGVRT
ncbi:MAG: hypothetical protein KDE19_19780, partial [Caldilineaceae bacterium]|nr:hypothetical protein [Caldilineaceae bacterium]